MDPSEAQLADATRVEMQLALDELEVKALQFARYRMALRTWRQELRRASRRAQRALERTGALPAAGRGRHPPTNGSACSP
ncbi:MAG: hypothetical protein R3F17_06170 [Planctomycetota bacterium]